MQKTQNGTERARKSAVFRAFSRFWSLLEAKKAHEMTR
jgi:hypothetical protein